LNQKHPKNTAKGRGPIFDQFSGSPQMVVDLLEETMLQNMINFVSLIAQLAFIALIAGFIGSFIKSESISSFSFYALMIGAAVSAFAAWVFSLVLVYAAWGVLGAVIAAMTGPQGDAARIEWEFRARVRRDSALTQTMAATLGLSETDLDELFATAATL
jgi:hypothetical protein